MRRSLARSGRCFAGVVALVLCGSVQAEPLIRARAERVVPVRMGQFVLRSVRVLRDNPGFGKGVWQVVARYDVEPSALRATAGDALAGIDAMPTAWCPLKKADGGAEVILRATLYAGMPDTVECESGVHAVKVGGLCGSMHRNSGGNERVVYWTVGETLFSVAVRSGSRALKSPDEALRAAAQAAVVAVSGAAEASAEDASMLASAVERGPAEARCERGPFPR